MKWTMPTVATGMVDPFQNDPTILPSAVTVTLLSVPAAYPSCVSVPVVTLPADDAYCVKALAPKLNLMLPMSVLLTVTSARFSETEPSAPFTTSVADIFEGGSKLPSALNENG